MEFLGIIIVEGIIQLQEHVLQKLVASPNTIRDKKQLQRFLGALNYVRYFYKGQVEDAAYLLKRLKN